MRACSSHEFFRELRRCVSLPHSHVQFAQSDVSHSAVPPLDLKDGFVHLSTAQQLPGTLNRFFAEHSEVVLLKIDYARLAAFKRVKWEQASNGDTFPHLYGAGIEGEYVDSFKELKRLAGASAQGEKGAEASWDDVLEDLKKEGWLQA